MARCAEKSSAWLPLVLETFTDPGASDPSRRIVNTTDTGGAVCRRESSSAVFQLRATWSRNSVAYAPNCVPNGEAVPTPRPPPPGILNIGELAAWPPRAYSWFEGYCCWAAHLLGWDLGGISRGGIVFRFFRGIALGSGAGALVFGSGLVLAGGGAGTLDSVSFATG